MLYTSFSVKVSPCMKSCKCDVAGDCFCTQFWMIFCVTTTHHRTTSFHSHRCQDNNPSKGPEKQPGVFKTTHKMINKNPLKTHQKFLTSGFPYKSRHYQISSSTAACSNFSNSSSSANSVPDSLSWRYQQKRRKDSNKRLMNCRILYVLYIK